jgi:hypothetical protein
MELYKREFFISRIRSGYVSLRVGGKRLIVHHPSIQTVLRSNEIYMEEYGRAIEEELFDDDDVYNLLVAIGLWSEKQEKEFEKIVPDHIEYWKIELYKNILKSNTRITIRKYLDVAKNELNRLYNVRHSFDHMTCAGYASYVKSMFLISRCTTHNNKRVDWAKFDLNRVMGLYHENLLSGMWSVLKANGKIFDTTNITTEQQALISWSSMYDKIYESPDCPPEEVIEDDDMLDGWLLIQKRQREVDKKKHEVENIANKKIANAGEIFLMAETPQDAQKIDLLNDPHAAQIKKQKLQEIKNRGNVLEQQLSDVKRKRAIQIQQAYINQVKGR